MYFLLTSFAFLRMSPSPYINGVGTASTSMDGIYQIFWNPAGIDGKGFITSLMMYGGLKYMGFGYTGKIKGKRIGLSLLSLVSDKLIYTNEDGDSLGTFYYANLVPGVSYSDKAGEKLLYGISVFTPYKRVQVYRSYGLGMNLGVIYKFKENIRLGILGRNIGYIFRPLVDYKYPLDYEIRGGVMYKMESGFITTDISYPFNLSVGTGMKIGKNFLITGGFNSVWRESSNYGPVDLLSGVNFGLFFRKGGMRFSYVAVFMGNLGITHNLGIVYGK